MRSVASILAVAITVAGCASSGPGLSGARPPEALAAESFAYEAFSNRDVRVSVDRAVLAGQADFIPSDPNWLQLRVTVANVGNRTINLTQIQEQLERGTNIAVVAAVPLSEMFGYIGNLRAMSSGRASYTMEFSHYDPVPKNVADAVIAEATKAKAAGNG